MLSVVLLLYDMIVLLSDINECKEDGGICQHNCTNTIGNYELYNYMIMICFIPRYQ